MADVYVRRLKKNYEPILRDLEPGQVLNYLYQEDVIDGDLRDEIRAERTRTKQAEALLASLERRGPEAVQHFITGLQKSSQRHLAAILQKPLPNESTAPPSDIHGQHSNDVYTMTKDPCGLAVIINNDKFDTSTGLEMRTGAAQDVLKMEKLFKQLRFVVTTHNNLTAAQMQSQVRRLWADQDHTSYDCFMLFFMSHGRHDGVYGTDGEVLHIKYLTDHFSAKNCPSLANKPKLFFVQACRGNKPDKGVDVCESPRPVNTSDIQPSQETSVPEPLPDLDMFERGQKLNLVIPNDSDIFIGFASSSEHAALRNTESGGWFVNALHEVMNKDAKKEDLMSMMTKVTNAVSEMESRRNYKQCPQQWTNLRKKLFFKPRI